MKNATSSNVDQFYDSYIIIISYSKSKPKTTSKKVWGHLLEFPTNEGLAN